MEKNPGCTWLLLRGGGGKFQGIYGCFHEIEVPQNEW